MRMVIRIAALSAALAIAAGAFGAHALQGRGAELLRTGGFYQLVHAVAVLALAGRAQVAALWTLLGGSGLFALSLYALALGAPSRVGAITPLGGAAMIAGWLWIAWRAGSAD